MAGSISITLFPVEDYNVDLRLEARRAAKVLVADLSAGTVRLIMRSQPGDATVLTIESGETVSGCQLNVISEADGVARLFIPTAFWAGKSQNRFDVECFVDTPDGQTQRFGQQSIDLAR